MSQQSPSSANAGGSFTWSRTLGCNRVSIRARASLWNSSFCAWAAGVAMLGSAQGLRLGCRIERRLRAVGPGQPPQRGFIGRATAWRAHGQQPGFALDHHRARFAQRGRDQRDPHAGVEVGPGADPLAARAGLAEAAPGHDQPGPPLAGGRHLLPARPEGPVPFEHAALVVGHRRQLAPAFLGVEAHQELQSRRRRHDRRPCSPDRPRRPGRRVSPASDQCGC